MNYGVAHNIHTTFFKAEIFFFKYGDGVWGPQEKQVKTNNTLWTNDLF